LEDIVWIDEQGREYTMDEIDNKYLINILGFICRGGGYEINLTAENIINLFIESYERGLNYDKSLSNAVLNKEEN
jgi:hypothetical protein